MCVRATVDQVENFERNLLTSIAKDLIRNDIAYSSIMI